ncbi:DNA-binding transcriptional repressor NikR [Hyphomicrobiales bacterium]|nr:DNA-binding transcriptional repressor NikR [Hyphomicrobiales bacterium]CAH1672918.1 DNA-binding transcriptional repressor NikR [Hyphomicrobiales bacterium]
MQRITVTIDDDLLAGIDAFCERKGYQSRSEALRDVIRAEFSRKETLEEALPPSKAQGHGVLSYVYDHHTRALASRLTSNHHDHSDLSVATMHVHVDHDLCLEVSILKGTVHAMQHFADSVSSQRGVRHGHLHVMPAGSDEAHEHGHGHGHAHTHPAGLEGHHHHDD